MSQDSACLHTNFDFGIQQKIRILNLVLSHIHQNLIKFPMKTPNNTMSMKMLKLLPKFLRIKLIRHKLRVMPKPDNFQVNIATTQIELEKAYALLHDCYVGANLMHPDPSGLRLNFFSFLPNTTTVVAKIDGVVVGTVSLIKDSFVGLPSDKDFRYENDQLRASGHHLVEVSSLAIDPKYRKKGHAISLYLMKYLQHYTTHHMGCTTVTCVVHPRARDFYAAFWGFKANKKIVNYKFVNNALGVQVFGDITDKNMSKLKSAFSKDEEHNLISFLFRNEPALIYPERKIAHHTDPIYTPDLLKHFLCERTDTHTKLSKTELVTIYSAYSLFFEKLDSDEFFKEITGLVLNKRQFRFPTKIEATIQHENKSSNQGFIMDLTSEGAFFATTAILDLTKEYNIEFELEKKQFSFSIRPCWQNRRTRNHQMLGYGVQFSQPQLMIAQILKKTHLTAELKLAK